MSKTRVVVADDQNISRGFFEMYVRASSDYELVAGLRTAQAAVDYVDKNEVDLLILDVMMQDGIDGITAAEKIKQKHPEVKIILTTSASEDNLIGRAYIINHCARSENHIWIAPLNEVISHRRRAAVMGSF